jgi:hypothetical protein
MSVNYSYSEIILDGMRDGYSYSEVCASCGGADVNINRSQSKDKSLQAEHCFTCNYAEGLALCMPCDGSFYQEAKETIKKLN